MTTQLDLYTDGGAQLYAAAVRESPGTDLELTAVVRACRGGRRVLDLGCGSGRFTLPLLARGHAVVALDNSTAMLDQLHAAARGLRDTAALEVVLADMSEFELPGRTFDRVVLGTTTVSLLEDEARRITFGRAAAHLATGGHFLVSTMSLADGPARPATTVRRFALDNDPAAMAVLTEQIDRVAGVRRITLQAEAGGPIYVSAPRIVDERDLIDDLGAAGFAVTTRQVVERGVDRDVVLLDCEVSA